VVEPLRFVLSKCQDLPRAVRELVEAIHMTGSLTPFSAYRASSKNPSSLGVLADRASVLLSRYASAVYV
jgi:hypothetical protein